MLELRYFGDPALRRHTSPVRRFDRELIRFVREMVDAMYAYRGIGLAAPQVGVLRQILVLDVSEEADEPEVLINPRILRRSDTVTEREGCLSLPGLQVEIARAREIEVRYQDEEGVEVTRRESGLWARVVQHEMDHLEGRLITDFMEPEVRAAFEREWPELRGPAVVERANRVAVEGGVPAAQRDP